MKAKTGIDINAQAMEDGRVHVVDGHIHATLCRSDAKVNTTLDAAPANRSLPDQFTITVRVEPEHGAVLVPGDKEVSSIAVLHEQDT